MRACPVCGLTVSEGELGRRFDRRFAELVLANAPGWRPEAGICLECRERFQRALDHVESHPAPFVHGAARILPAGLRLGARPEYRGRGVTIAFLDAGYYAHPDLDGGRILKYVDVTNPRARRRDIERADESSWHGMMTSVVACGNGKLAGGFYRSLASEARLVLVRVGGPRRVVHDDIRRGLDWVIQKRRALGIRLVNVSCGGDYEKSYLEDRLSQSVERAAREGILVVAAVGNLGHLPGHPVLPPASAPSALTVGGLDDRNRLAFSGYGLYHSSYGPTLDGLQKPEVVAPSIWVAAPILPGTETAARAALLARLAQAPDRELATILAKEPGVDPVLDAALGLSPTALRQLVTKRLHQESLISAAYKHVDGTSFAAPIVTSVAAQMLEANPRLTPSEVKRILIKTARRIAGVEVDRQGWGAVDPRRAVEEALRRRTGARAAPRV